MSAYRIRVHANAAGAWPFTARLERWDGTGWMQEDAEDGDTAAEAVEELRRCNRIARRLP